MRTDCPDNNSLVLVPMCDHLRAIASPLLCDLTPRQLTDVRDAALARAVAARGTDDDLPDINARLICLAHLFVNILREDKVELDAIQRLYNAPTTDV